MAIGEKIKMAGLKAELEYSFLEGYEVRSYWSCDDEVYVAEILNLPGCAADGETRDEALRNMALWKEEWVQTVKGMGYPIPTPKYEPGRVMA